MNRYICIHGHFYQPPRENPWLEDVELQDSAYPYHDWNARITEECYRQNATSRILGRDKKIVDIVNNYERISFNFGPTLLYWLESHAPDVYEKIIEADKNSRERFSGHGCALAQAYNHMILPLSNTNDKHTQIIWAIRDFQKRFGREPEGMWLPETAVDIPTLEALVERGIKFTILAPHQAKRVRKMGTKRWKQVNENELDTTIPYICNLPSGKQISLFFYNKAVSHEIAYGGLLHSGENFANRLTESFPRDKDHGESSLVSIATDGESFGHHHRHGDMALSYCLHHIETNNLAKITNYGEYLERFGATNEVEIWENSSWSCVHGVERWKSNCGCCANQSRAGQQEWRGPLREALDWLRDRIAEIYEQKMSTYHSDVWRLRNDYINVVNNRSEENIERFILDTTGRQLDEVNKVAFIKLLEMQRNAMLMYTSCGWFFDNISGIETIQVLLYAARAIQLCGELQGVDLESEFKELLERAPARGEQFANGKQVYETYVEPVKIDLHRVGAHLALVSVFENYREEGTDIYCYSTKAEEHSRVEAGVQVLTTAWASIRSKITLERQVFGMVALYLGDQNLFAALGTGLQEEKFHQMQKELNDAFRQGDNNKVMHLMNTAFDGEIYSLSHLFKDQQRKILNELLADTWQEIESSFRHIYEHHYSIMQMIRNMNMPLPRALAGPAEFIITEDLSRQIRADKIDISRLQGLVEEAARLSLDLDRERLKFESGRKISRLMGQLEKSPEDTQLLQSIERTLEILKSVAADMDLQHAQNIFFTIAKDKYPQVKSKAESGEPRAQDWVESFKNLAQYLGLAVP